MVDVGLIACGRSNVWYPGDAFEGGGDEDATGGSSGKGANTGGKGGTFTFDTGGTGTGGTAGSGNVGNGGTLSTGGSTVGGTGGSSGSAGVPNMGPGPFECAYTEATCDSFTNFSTANATTFGSGTFTGGVSVVGDGLAYTDGANVHVTGAVRSYGSGIILWFTTCSDLSAFSGVTFTIEGGTGFGNTVEFMPLTNSDYPWQPRPEDKKGACTATDATNPFSECIAPVVKVGLGPMPQYVFWNEVAGGYPIPWVSTFSPWELVGLEWHFPWDPSFGSYAVDMTLDNITFIGGVGNDCGPGPGVGGMGGMGGIAGFGGFGGAGFGGVAGTGMAGNGAGGMPGSGAGGMPGGGFWGSGSGGVAGGAGSGGFGAAGTSGSAGDGGTSTEGGASFGGDGFGGA
jgi:hypothetical protein